MTEFQSQFKSQLSGQKEPQVCQISESTPPHEKSWLIGKDSDAGRDWGQEEKGTTEDEMAGWHHWLDGRESGWTPGAGDGQGGLACCDSWGRRVGHDWATDLIWSDKFPKSRDFWFHDHTVSVKITQAWVAVQPQRVCEQRGMGVFK